MMKHIQGAIASEIGLMLINSKKPWANQYRIGELYLEVGQRGAAFSFFIRSTATPDIQLRYNALVKAFLCIYELGNRTQSAEILAMHALSIFPDGAEAYYHLAKLYEKTGQCNLGYVFASLGAILPESGPNEDLNYPGRYGLLFYKAYHAWWTGRFEESRMIFQELKRYNNVVNEYWRDLIQTNLSRLGSTDKTFIMYDKSLLQRLKVKFPGVDKIEKNHSQTYQDMFVLSVLNGRRCGSFFEIGCADPFVGNNTALLEQFEWSGVSIDNRKEEIEKYVASGRNTQAICADAMRLDYDAIIRDKFAGASVIDYLQIDCDPPENTFNILLMLPLDKVKFAVIHFEHDHYSDFDGVYRDLSRKYLTQHGYELVVPDVAPDHRGSYEDWWVMPDLVHTNNKNRLKMPADRVNCVTDVMLMP